MKKVYVGTLLLLGLASVSRSQEMNLLFASKDPIHLQASGSTKAIKKNTNDSTYTSGKFLYEKQPGEWIEIETEARVRGNFRLKNCYFPPLKLKFKKKNIEGTVFEGNKTVKLVLPCKRQNNMNPLIGREYICYKFYEELTPFHFKTRLINLELTEKGKRKDRVYDLLAFMVEDNSKVAERSKGKVIEMKGLSPAAFDAAQTLRNDYFQYMIGNADWSAVYQHNSNILFADGKYMPLPYDFDMSGLVNADYAQVNPPSLGTGDPRERVYRGFCKEESVMEAIRKEYLSLEKRFHALIDENAVYVKENDVTDMHSYLDEFYQIMKDDRLFKNSILQGCRTNK